jgi:UDP-glucose 4-epimerase
MDKPTILVTGGAGYIGSHTVLALKEAGYQVVILDNLVYGHRDVVEASLQVELITGDIGDRRLLKEIFAKYAIAGVLHFAAYAYVGESVTNPAKYYQNNVCATLNLLESMVEAGVLNFVFSSTCATYGNPVQIPIPEEHPQDPINPYGATKLMVERILDDFDQAYGLRSVRFRYFNAAGADPLGRLGEDHHPETHLIPLVLMAAMGKRENITIFGTDYKTPDGTCIRDYIHVTDLAQAHVLGLEYLFKEGATTFFNLGNGDGFSVRDIIQAAHNVTGCQIPVVEGLRRPGDPAVLIGSSAKAQQMLGWEPQFKNIEVILEHAWKWHQKRHGAA